MSSAPNGARLQVDVGLAFRALAGEAVSGDACVSLPWSRGTLVTVVDGLGHGEHAAVASRAFVDAVRSYRECDLAAMFERAHLLLLRTRGAVAAVARFDADLGRVELGSIGNVTTVFVPGGAGRTIHPLVFPGVLGSAYRSLRAQSFDFGIGDTMVMHSDGIRSSFDLGSLRAMSAQVAADVILSAAAKAADDASCVVVRGERAKADEPDRAASVALATRDAVPPHSMALRIAGDAACAAAQTRTFARRVGLPSRAQWEVSIAASELATNVLKFAGTGTLKMCHLVAPRHALVLEVADRGPGIPDVRAAIVDGWSEGARLTPERAAAARGLGVGLGSVHRMMDAVTIQTTPGQGTRIVATKYVE